MAQENSASSTPRTDAHTDSSTPRTKRSPRRKNQRRKATAAHHQQRRARLKAARAAHPVAVTYPDDLPVTAAKDEIAEAIRDNQVVIIAGETGSRRPDGRRGR